MEELLNMEWFTEFKDVSNARRNASPEQRFQAYALTSTNAGQIAGEIERVQAAINVTDQKNQWDKPFTWLKRPVISSV